MDFSESSDRLRSYTSDIVAAFSSKKNPMSAQELPTLIHSVYATLAGLGNAERETVNAPRQPPVPVKKSVFPDYIVCLEDGKKLTMLKRHLMTAYGMTPDAYREKWHLPPDYPMVAPNYATRRSKLARQFGLGRKPEPVPEPIIEVMPPAPPPPPEPEPEPEPVPEPVLAVAEIESVPIRRIPPKKRGRKPAVKPQELDPVEQVAD